MNQPIHIAREPRTRMQGRLAYTCDAGHAGHAQWLDLSRVGACILLGRYVKPGRELRLRLDSPLASGGRLELRARVLWCRQVQQGPEFAAGLYIRRDTPEMALGFAVLGHAARHAENKRRTAPVEAAVAKHAAARTRTAAQHQPAALALARAV